jgi:hypothetical protein
VLGPHYPGRLSYCYRCDNIALIAIPSLMTEVPNTLSDVDNTAPRAWDGALRESNCRAHTDTKNRRFLTVRVIQFSNLIPMRVNARSGWAAKRRHAAAMLE